VYWQRQGITEKERERDVLGKIGTEVDAEKKGSMNVADLGAAQHASSSEVL
jgi:hypothetical protein